MKKLLLLCLVLLGGVMQVSATDYSIGADESGWKIKGQMTDNGDGTFSYIIDLPANYTNYLFTIFEGTSINSDWSNAYRPDGAGANWGVDANNTPTMKKGANNYVLIFPVSSTIARSLKVVFTPSTGACTITRLIAVASGYNHWSTTTDYLEETGRGSNIYTGIAPLEKETTGYDNGFQFVGINNNDLKYYSYKKDGDNEWIDVNQDNATVSDDGVYTLTAKFSDYKWVAPVRVTVPASVATYGMGTISSPYALDFTNADKIQAYAITGVSGKSLTLSDRITGKVPANTGLYIEGTENTDIPTTIYTTSLGVTNCMVAGTGEKVYTSDGGSNTNFFLTTNKGASATPKFYKVNSEGTVIPVGKAYLQIPTSSVGAHDFFWFENEATGIANVDVNANDNFDANAPMYNLAGQRVGKNYKGVVIVNGKKVIIK